MKPTNKLRFFSCVRKERDEYAGELYSVFQTALQQWWEEYVDETHGGPKMVGVWRDVPVEQA